VHSARAQSDITTTATLVAAAAIALAALAGGAAAAAAAATTRHPTPRTLIDEAYAQGRVDAMVENASNWLD
jgi:hypothetical protein